MVETIPPQYQVLNGEEMLVWTFVVLDGYPEAQVAAYLTALLPRVYTRDRVHRIKRTARDKMAALVVRKGTAA